MSMNLRDLPQTKNFEDRRQLPPVGYRPSLSEINDLTFMKNNYPHMDPTEIHRCYLALSAPNISQLVDDPTWITNHLPSDTTDGGRIKLLVIVDGQAKAVVVNSATEAVEHFIEGSLHRGLPELSFRLESWNRLLDPTLAAIIISWEAILRNGPSLEPSCRFKPASLLREN